MNFDLSDEQKMLAAETRKLLVEGASAASLRKLADAGVGWDARLWQAVAELGLLGAAVPEALGGVGLCEFDICVICEEMGRGPAPLPYMSSIGMVAEAIRLAGSDEQKSEWLPRLASGQAIGVYACHESGAGCMNATVHSGRLTGRKTPVADLHIGHVAVVGAMEHEQPGLYLVDMAERGIEVRPLEGFDLLRRYGAVAFAGTTTQRLPGSSHDFIQAMENRAAIYTAFEQIGGAEACLYMARDYAMQRKTFGRSVASYQAIKHKLADILLEIEMARSNAYYAAWALAAGAPDVPEAAAVARLSATAAYDAASRENLHVHGGFGYTWEADCHFHYRRARVLAASLGGPDMWARRLMTGMQQRNAWDRRSGQ